MSIAIKPVAANLIRQMSERHPDLSPMELARKGGWNYGQVVSALQSKMRDRPKSRVS